jgi:LacI family transcriptional regulator
MHTIRDVARLAGVSVPTVSKVLNNKGPVSAKLTKRVMDAMKAIDYQPDHVARSLKVRKTNTIGVIVPDILGWFWVEVIKGIENEARSQGYSVILCDSAEDPAVEEMNINTLFARRVDGILLDPTTGFRAHERFSRRRLPLVLFDRVSAGFKGAAVIVDNFGAACAATRHLIELGHERIAIITGPLNLSPASDRLEGFRHALQKAHLPLHEEYLRCGDYQLKSGYQYGMELMRLEVPPTAVFCCGNRMTMGLTRALRDLGVPYPDQVSVVGFDDFDWMADLRVALTTVAQPALEIGKQAMQLMVRQLKALEEGAGSDGEEVVTLKAELRVRDSTRPPSPSLFDKILQSSK